jgi:signal transduction histidine kinase
MRVPVRLRLTLAFAVVMAVVLTAAGLFVHQRSRANLDRALASSLHARSADIATLAQQSDSGLKEATVSRRAEVAQILDRRGHVIDQTPGLPHGPLVTGRALDRARRGRSATIDARLPSGQPGRLLATQVRGQDRPLIIVVGQSLVDRNRALNDLAGVLMLGGPIALVLACVAGYALTGAALRPVDALRRRADAISASDLEARLPSAGGNDELGRLGRTLNQMLARIHESVARERTFVADASHELRTPLTMLRTELELIERDLPSGADLQAAARSAIDETDRLTRLADDLLLLARADHGEGALRAEPVLATVLLADAAARARRRAPEGGVEVAVVDDGEAAVLADRDRVAQALDNVVDNARRHARGRVDLYVQLNGGLVDLHVVDDGPGFPEDFLPHAWERFARPDAGRTEDGTGLGLAIVRTIAEMHGGHAGARNRPGGGADVWIALPAAGLSRLPTVPAGEDARAWPTA